MSNPRRSAWAVSAALIAGVIVAVLLGAWIGWALTNGNDGGANPGLRQTKIDRMLGSGQIQAMLDQHRQMMEQMRVDASPQMRARMDADPMWKLMRNDEFTKMMEDQQQQIDRMLGRGSP